MSAVLLFGGRGKDMCERTKLRERYNRIVREGSAMPFKADSAHAILAAAPPSPRSDLGRNIM